MKRELIYVELKSGYNDDGPAWIGFAGESKSGATIYFNGQALKSLKGSGISGNYYDADTGDEYWISGVKQNNQDRHWAGGGIIHIDELAVDEYLGLMNWNKLPSNIAPTTLAPSKFDEEHHNRENAVLNPAESPVLARRPVKQRAVRLQEKIDEDDA